VPDRHLTLQRAQALLVEDLAHEAEVALGDDVAAAVGARDPRGLLPAVLERVEREEHEPRGLARIGRRWGPDAAHAAHG